MTTADYESLARNVNGVAKVRAGAEGSNEVTLFVAPAGGGKVSDDLEIRLKAYFEDKRMLSQVVEIDDVDYVEIRVTATWRRKLLRPRGRRGGGATRDRCGAGLR